ncbi:MAG: phosphotransferase [Dehalococcoidia bacterium]
MRADGAGLLAAARRAVMHWDFDGAALQLMTLSENVVFRVESAGGAAYALRLHRPGYNSLAELNSERVWTAALLDADIDVARAVPTARGEWYATVTMPDGTARHAGMLEWVDGELLSHTIARTTDVRRVVGYFEQLGRYAARIHNQSSRWRPPAGFERRAWNTEGLIGERPLWGRFWDVPELRPDERDVLLRARDAIRCDLDALGTDDACYSLIHADMHPHNVIVAGDRLGAIDFDDAGFGWHLYELAVALQSARGASYGGAATAALVAGYRAERPLAEEHVLMLPTFALIRSLVIVGWRSARPELGGADRMRPLIERTTEDARAFLASRSRR